MITVRKNAELIILIFLGTGGQIDDFVGGHEHELSSEEFRLLRRAY
jgi:hypothetical protein